MSVRVSCPKTCAVSITLSRLLASMRTVPAASDETEYRILQMEEMLPEMQVTTHHLCLFHLYIDFLMGMLATETLVIKPGMLHFRLFQGWLNAQS